MQDVNPRDVTFREKIPDEVLRQGWLPVLKYLRELGDRSAAIEEVHLIFAGEGEQGKILMRVLTDTATSTIDPKKTRAISLMRALLDKYTRSFSVLQSANSTVDAGIETGWRPGGEDGPTMHLVDVFPAAIPSRIT